jgi:hypothetical protein
MLLQNFQHRVDLAFSLPDSQSKMSDKDTYRIRCGDNLSVNNPARLPPRDAYIMKSNIADLMPGKQGIAEFGLYSEDRRTGYSFQSGGFRQVLELVRSAEAHGSEINFLQAYDICF